MAASSIGRNTVVDMTHAHVLLEAVRKQSALAASGRERRPVSLSEIHTIGYPIRRRDWPRD